LSGSPWTALRRLADAPTETLAQRAALLAAVMWADADGKLRPSMATWARVAGMKLRTLQRVLRQLEALGVVEQVRPSIGGHGRTTVYRVPLLDRNPDAVSGLEPRHTRPTTPTGETPNPDVDGSKPRPTVGGTSKNGLEQPWNGAPPPAALGGWNSDAIAKALGDAGEDGAG
jgi:hypothetical protein